MTLLWMVAGAIGGYLLVEGIRDIWRRPPGL